MRTPEERRQRHIAKTNTSHTQSNGMRSERTFKSGDSIMKESLINGKKFYSRLHATESLAKVSGGGGTVSLSPALNSSTISGANNQLFTTDGDEVDFLVGEDVLDIIGSNGITTGGDDTNNQITVTLDAAQTGITSLLAADIKIGEDDETKIDFETPDRINFYADNAERARVVSTGMEITGNVTISGDLTVAGGESTGSSTTITTTDSMVGLASDNAANSVDIGIYGKYSEDSGVTDRFTGVVWDSSESEWVIFDGTTTEPTTIVNPGLTGYDLADLHLGKIEADDASVLATGTTIGNLTLANGSITDSGGTITISSLNLGDSNITNVGDISLDSISADGTSISIDSNWDAAGVTCSNLGSVTTVDINGGTIDNTAIGGSVRASGQFTILEASGNVELGDAVTDLIRINGSITGDLLPSSNNLYDIGSSTSEWKDLWLDGKANVDNLVVDDNALISGTLDVDSTSNFQGLITIQTGIVPDTQDGAYLGTSSLQWSDLFLADGAVIYFGDDNEVSLTHAHNAGLLLSGNDQLQFGDSGTYINQSADGQLDIVADKEIELTSDVVQLIASEQLDIDTSTINLGEDDTSDVTLNFLGSTNDGALVWDESAEQFLIMDDLVMVGTERIYFGTSKTGSIYSYASTEHLTIDSDTEVSIIAPTLDIDGDTTVTIDTPILDMRAMTGTGTVAINTSTSFTAVSGSASLVLDNADDEVTVNSLRVDDLSADSFVLCDVVGSNNDLETDSNFLVKSAGQGFSFPGINYNSVDTSGIMNITGSPLKLNSSDIDINGPYAFTGSPFETSFDEFLVRYDLNGNSYQHLAGGKADYIQNYSWIGGYILQTEDYLFESGGGGPTP